MFLIIHLTNILLNQGFLSSWKQWRWWNDHGCDGCWLTWWREGEWPSKLCTGDWLDQGKIWNLIIHNNLHPKTEQLLVSILSYEKLFCCVVRFLIFIQEFLEQVYFINIRIWFIYNLFEYFKLTYVLEGQC